MKRILAVIMSFALIMSIAACGKRAEETEASTTAMHTTGTVDETMSDIGFGEIKQEKYRQCYYQVTYQLTQLVDKEELEAWKPVVFEKSPNDTNEMIVKRFVQDFNISKEEFERANLQTAKYLKEEREHFPAMNPKDYVNQEMYEIYNADIIYTFDDEIINNYYLSHDYPFCYASEYEEAVANGTYETRTTDWVDVDQMEAEINAKYGTQETAAVIETTAE